MRDLGNPRKRPPLPAAGKASALLAVVSSMTHTSDRFPPFGRRGLVQKYVHSQFSKESEGMI